MEKNSSYAEALRHENEITKLKLQAEFGLNMNSGENNLNPAIENIWLNQILEYERSLLNNKPVKIAELLNNPRLKPVEEINDADLPANIQKVMELLQSVNIVVDSVSGVDDREMYRFITQELLNEEVNISSPKNMITCYIYEEFYPNDEYDIHSASTNFINTLCKKEDESFEMYLYKNSDEEKEISSENLVRKLKLFRDAFDKIKLEDFTISSIEITGTDAIVKFDFRFSLLPVESRNSHIIGNEGSFKFIKDYDFWCIEKIDMKGIVEM